MQTGSIVLRVVAALAAGVVVGAGVVMLVRGPSPAGDPDRDGTSTASPSEPAAPPSVSPEQLAAVHDYLDEVQPIAREAGRVVQEGMKPAITELSDPEGDHQQQAQGAPGWRAAMETAREDWGATTPPPALRAAHELFLDALETYTEAAERLGEAATDDDRRATLVEEAIELGTRGDDLYDRAAGIVQAHLVAGGEDPVTWLPQPREDR